MEITIMCTIHLLEWLKVKMLSMPSVGEEEKPEPIYIAVRSAKIARDAITKVHRPGTLNNRIYFLTSLQARSLRSRCGQDWFLLGTFSLAYRCLSSPCVFEWSSFCMYLSPDLIRTSVILVEVPF